MSNKTDKRSSNVKGKLQRSDDNELCETNKI